MNKNGKNGARLHRKHRKANRLCHVKGRGCRNGLEYKYYICDWKDRVRHKEKRQFKMHWADILADIEEDILDQRLAEEEAKREAMFREVYGPCMYDYDDYEDYMDAVFEWGYRRGFEEGYKSGYEMWLREVGA